MRDWIWIGGARPTMRQIAKEVCEGYGITLARLRENDRWPPLVRARQEFMWRARTETIQSFPQIGAFLGGRHHTTVIHGVRAHERRMKAPKMGTFGHQSTNNPQAARTGRERGRRMG